MERYKELVGKARKQFIYIFAGIVIATAIYAAILLLSSQHIYAGWPVVLGIFTGVALLLVPFVKRIK